MVDILSLYPVPHRCVPILGNTLAVCRTISASQEKKNILQIPWFALVVQHNSIVRCICITKTCDASFSSQLLVVCSCCAANGQTREQDFVTDVMVHRRIAKHFSACIFDDLLWLRSKKTSKKGMYDFWKVSWPTMRITKHSTRSGGSCSRKCAKRYVFFSCGCYCIALPAIVRLLLLWLLLYCSACNCACTMLLLVK